MARIIAYGHTNIFKAYRRLPETSKYEFLDEIRFLDIEFLDLVTLPSRSCTIATSLENDHPSS